MIFWISFCLVGQPLAALLYFFAWQAKYGSVSKQIQNPALHFLSRR
jgi:diacylglycerol O-acyltransferase-1